MKAESTLLIECRTCSTRQLIPADGEAIQGLFERCLDYMLLVDGHPPGANAGANTFTEIPPGRCIEDHFIFGILDQQQMLVGLLDVMRNYPDEGSWWIGLLLIDPQARTHGLGRAVVEGFERFVRSSGGQVIMLGVVEENQAALEFWKKMGFEFVSRSEPTQFGNKTHVVDVFRLKLTHGIPALDR